MARQRGIFIVLLALGLMLASISCAIAQVPPQQSPTESLTPTLSQSPSTTSETPSDLNTLTDADKAKAIKIVLNTPEAKAVLTVYPTYTADFNSVTTVWVGSVIKERLVDMRLHFGNVEPGFPEGRVLLDATVDLVSEKTVGHVVGNPLKKLPVP